ncbi:hypothetical protein ART_0542 [Arthrobacter sp. PAMC 25486]|nr:hypothetical protein ART_0542 [Arthrobacter sp. PAMC 25486]
MGHFARSMAHLRKGPAVSRTVLSGIVRRTASWVCGLGGAL